MYATPLVKLVHEHSYIGTSYLQGRLFCLFCKRKVILKKMTFYRIGIVLINIKSNICFIINTVSLIRLWWRAEICGRSSICCIPIVMNEIYTWIKLCLCAILITVLCWSRANITIAVCDFLYHQDSWFTMFRSS